MSTLVYSTSTGDAPQAPDKLDCPGCTGETSTSVGVMLGCTFCAL
jgi:hypothetical protein